MSLQQRMQNVEQRIRAACARSGRQRNSVKVAAVTKYVSLDTTIRAVEAGLTNVGENRWQDAQPKWEAIGSKASWHFLGHLQTNKVKEVVGRFDYIHSLDRLSLAKELHKKADALDISVNCFIQVNVSGEESKFGLPPGELFSFAEQLRTLDRIHVAGLMTMAPYESEPEATRPVFAGLRSLRDELNERKILAAPVTELSMGMSNDFEVAVEEGATWLRLGTVLVGKEEE
ncbi:YggS family pyridoxal phosphate-dependent enzyme [Paenibacillus gansuensis]|uniref:Pyridoxal phosphate homeostasis protein n=1 Tax=Paenibacillus gansuensis TaxID=306542 RepID=A0ABW5PBV1_9BACL